MIELYTLATPNGQKVSIALEELGASYNTHIIDILKGDQFAPHYIEINPNSKIPSIIDTDGPGGAPITLMESGAILIYLAEKYGRLLSKDPRERSETIQWLCFQIGHIGPMFGQFGHFFKYAAQKCDHPYPLARYTNEAKRLLGVLDKRLEKTGAWISGGDYSIADIAIVPWVNCLSDFYEATNQLSLSEFGNVRRWQDAFNKRRAVIIGRDVGRIT